MFAFLIGKKNLIHEGVNNNKNQIYNKKLGNMEVELKTKLNRVKIFNPDDCYDSDNSEDESNRTKK